MGELQSLDADEPDDEPADEDDEADDDADDDAELPAHPVRETANTGRAITADFNGILTRASLTYVREKTAHILAMSFSTRSSTDLKGSLHRTVRCA